MRASTLFLSLHVAAVFALPQAPAPDCKVIAGDSAWPSAEEWQKAMPGKLLREKSTKAAKHPDYRIEATTPEDVVAAVKFAAKHNVRLSVINSGHDFMGRNDAPSGLHLAVGRLDGVRVTKSFRPTKEGEPPVKNNERPKKLDLEAGQGAFVTFGAGYSTQRLNNVLAKKNNLFTIGAAHGEVTVAGGWAQASGHTPLGPHYGMGADQVAEYQVVTADGKLRIANEESNPDLFWALRGGGGGAWGVVVQATVRAHASPKMVSANWYINTTDYNDQKSIYAPSAWLHTLLPDLADNKGWSGYYFIFPNAIKCSFLNIGEAATTANAVKVWQPIIEKFAAFPGIEKNSLVASVSEMPNYKAFLDAAFGVLDGDASPAGNSTVIAYPTNLFPVASPAAGPAHNKRHALVEEESGEPLMRRFYAELTGMNLQKRHGPGEDMEMAAMGSQAGGIVAMDSRLLGADAFNHPDFAKALEEAMPRMEKG